MIHIQQKQVCLHLVAGLAHRLASTHSKVKHHLDRIQGDTDEYRDRIDRCVCKDARLRQVMPVRHELTVS